MSAIAPELSYLFNSGQNLLQKPSNLGSCELNDPQQEELVQDTENLKHSNKGYGKSQSTLSRRRVTAGPRERGVCADSREEKERVR